jgi:tRNA (cmo5U34)-methyltransferase
VGQFHFRPDEYIALMESELPDYYRLQDAAAAATGSGAMRLLELGTGTGESALRVLARHARASLVGIDESADMLRVARERLPGADLRVSRLEDPLPDGPFDLVFSVLAIHHLDGPGKADLFRRVAAVLGPGGRFVIGDVVVPDDPADATTPLTPDYDLPSPADDQLAWLAGAGFDAELVWSAGDLAVIVAKLETATQASAAPMNARSSRPEMACSGSPTSPANTANTANPAKTATAVSVE